MGHQNGHQNGIFGVQSQTALQNLVPRAFPWKPWERGWALKCVVRNDHAKEYICLLLIDLKSFFAILRSELTPVESEKYVISYETKLLHILHPVTMSVRHCLPGTSIFICPLLTLPPLF